MMCTLQNLCSSAACICERSRRSSMCWRTAVGRSRGAMNLMPAIVMMTFSHCLECNTTKLCHGLFSVVSHVCATLNEDCLVPCLSDALGESFWRLNATGCSNRICWRLCPAHVQLIFEDSLRFSTHDNTCEISCVHDTVVIHLKGNCCAPQGSGNYEPHEDDQGQMVLPARPSRGG
jgi:hypothetical protein